MTHENEDDFPDLPSSVALDVKRLKHTVLAAASKRNPVPQPLFWSLFRSEIEKIRKQKSVEVTVKNVLGQILD